MAPRKKAETETNNTKTEEMQNLSLEESFRKLDEILETLENDEISLENSFAEYQRGMELLKYCSEKIDTVEKKILIMNGDGGFDEF